MSSPNTTEKQLPLESQHPEPTLDDLRQNAMDARRAFLEAWEEKTYGKWHRRPVFVGMVFFIAIMVIFWTVLIEESIRKSIRDEDDPTRWLYVAKVPLEAHIMSKCPDAKDCLHDLILPTMQKVSDQVHFKLSFIGSTTDHDDGVVCKHGSAECLGNIIELCAAKQYPDPKIYLGFVMCLTRDYEKIPQRALVEDCALEHGIDMDRLQQCTVDDEGAMSVDLLKDSFNRSASAGVTRSCTVRLNNEIRCIRDDGEWKDCEGGSSVDDLVKDILDLSDA